MTGKVYQGNALDILQAMPSEGINAVLTDAMYGVHSLYSVYDWGHDPAGRWPRKSERATKHWEYHEPIYRECLRVLKPGGVLAWAQGIKYLNEFPKWFGGHQIWSLVRYGATRQASGHIWIVQTREREPIRFPNKPGVIVYGPMNGLRNWHPCPKTVEEMTWIVDALTQPGDVVLDCFCGLGSTLVAAQKLGRQFIGCDLSRNYCRIAKGRLARLCPEGHIGSIADQRERESDTADERMTHDRKILCVSPRL
ncbi:MAG TPA: DNA methyltransferase [Pirellulales bacterium]|jgi:DNA modification methylase|nr:DNA methyltransferase [Pirellulales bacterium]